MQSEDTFFYKTQAVTSRFPRFGYPAGFIGFTRREGHCDVTIGRSIGKPVLECFTLKTKTIGFSETSRSRLRLKCDGTRAETRFRLSAKRTNPFKSAGASVQSTTGRRAVHISGSNAGYTMFRGGVKGTGYPLHTPVSPSLTLPCVTVCHHVSTGLQCWINHVTR
jgi:hypothetical protein